MQYISPWRVWRARFLPYAASIVGQVTSHPPSAAALQLCKRTGPFRRSSSVAEAQILGRLVSADERIDRFLRHGVEELYPRAEYEEAAMTVQEYRSTFGHLKENEALSDQYHVVRGRISSIRSASGKLFFLDIVEGPRNLQIVCDYSKLSNPVEKSLFKARCNDLSRGDVISIRGYPYRTARGELSVRATAMPKLLSPCLQPFPIDEFDRPEKDQQALLDADRHVQLLTVRNVMDTILCRSTVINGVRSFLLDQHFHEADTPILGAVASGATARPFETAATEFPDRRLALRIAPELWLKRLILGGIDRVFEIGPSFRNEGLDKTHNPEFTSCEFYKTHTTLPELMDMTQELIRYVHGVVRKRHTSSTLPIPSPGLFESDFPRLDFIPSLENALGLRLPNLSDHRAAESTLLQIFRQKSLPLPSSIPTLPRLLDKLSAIYLEPRCDRPTFIINHPECMSPLSKSYMHPTTGQKVAARAELFVHRHEIANMYEEENSPISQRKKFEMQKLFAHRAVPSPSSSSSSSSPQEEENMEPDFSYLEALEWGLPPTGGWGCGLDRLVMLMTGKERIADVLTFGNLRHVTRGAVGWGEEVKDKESDKEG